MTTTHTEAQPLLGLAAVPVDNVHPSPNNVRDHLTGIEELAQSISETGLIQPLVVQKIPGKDGYQIVAGHRRYAAVRRLGWAKVACIIRRDMLPDQELLTMLVENGQRAGLDPIEEARALNRLKNQMGISELEVSRRIGRSPGHVRSRIMLLSLPTDEQEQIRAGVTSLSEGHVKARVATGRIRTNAIGRSGVGHLAADHPLAARVKARCVHLKHARGKGKGVGGVACGECWEEVIRADERERINKASDVAGRCLICGTTHDPDRTDDEAI